MFQELWVSYNEESIIVGVILTIILLAYILLILFTDSENTLDSKKVLA